MVLFSFKVFFLVCLVLVGLVVVVLPVGAVDWLSGWEYRKEIIFDSVVDEGVQVTFNVTYLELNGHCQSDFDDLRFYYVNGSQAFAFNQTVVVSSYVTVWLRSDGSDSVYVYYGNSDVSSDWDDGSGVFEDVIGNVVLALPLDEGSGLVAVDYSGYGNDGIISNSQWVSDGIYGNALRVNATTDYIVVSHSASLNVSSEFSMIVWVKVLGNIVSDQYGFIGGKRGDNDEFYMVRFYLGSYPTANVEMRNKDVTGYSDVAPRPTIPNDAWCMSVFMKNSSYSYGYVNETKYESGFAKSPVGVSDYFFGSQNAVGYPLDGYLSCIFMMNRTLTDLEVSNIYSFYADSRIVEGSVVCRVWVDVMPVVSFGGEVVSNQVLQENLDFVWLLALLGVICALGALCWVLMR